MMSTSTSTPTPGARGIATLAGGCFWCLEAVFHAMQGVERVVSGYMGGTTTKPSYRDVCGGRTGHAEVVQIHFDPARVSYVELLEVFFAIHDPTTLNRQGNDVGTQYRSAIFCHDAEQEALARAALRRLADERVFADPVVTQVLPAAEFWPAEGYHQDYYRNNAYQPYCQFVVAPKLAKFRHKFAAKVKR